MNSWWELGEHKGYVGTTLATYNIACGYCGEKGNFAQQSHLEKKASKGKVLNYDILRCENCGNFTMAFWSAGYRLHDRLVVPPPLNYNTYPDSWPEDVGRYWLQAKRSQVSRNWDAAAVMARSTLQIALRKKGATGKNLFEEINHLFGTGDLPPLMKDWAHEIRLLGAESAHPASDSSLASQKDVADLISFLDFLLEYLFTLPAKIEHYRQRKLE